ncbi:MAG: hypothetical protein OXC13_08760 [Caldilineaceae bacterium]|nr:hypothetical protein [Caldilineaceae bacterium]
MPANTKAQADWHALLLSAARLQHEVRGSVLVGGAAVALQAGHRYSTDADHVVTDLMSRYPHVCRHLESVDGWVAARFAPPVVILGSLDGQAAGVRQLRRTVPLETQTIFYAGQPLCVPTYYELMRIKAFLVLDRNYTRDYVDFLALAAPLEQEDIEAALSTLDNLYGQLAVAWRSGKGLLYDLGTALRKAEPKDAHKRDFTYFEAMDPDRQPWDLARIRREGPPMGDRILTLWAQLDDDRRDADTPEAKLPRDRPNPYSGMF